MTRPGILAVALGVGSLVVGSRPALACAVCGCGDATLTSMGAEAPYRGRIRASLEARYREDAIGEEGENRIVLQEGRLDAGVSWAPHERFVGLLSVPFLYRHVTYVNLAERETLGLGDAEIRGKVLVFRDRPFGAHHLLSTTLGVKLPTAPSAEDEDGAPLPLELQPGTGSVDPILGLTYATFHGDWSGYGSAHAYYALPGRGGDRSSSSLRLSASVQRQLVPALALRLGVDTRVDARGTEDGRAAADSGGFIGFVTPEVLIQPREDVVLVATVRLPAVDALAGEHDESAILGLAAAVDF